MILLILDYCKYFILSLLLLVFVELFVVQLKVRFWLFCVLQEAVQKLAFLCTISSTKVLWICLKQFLRKDRSSMWLGFQWLLGAYGKDGIS